MVEWAMTPARRSSQLATLVRAPTQLDIISPAHVALLVFFLLQRLRSLPMLDWRSGSLLQRSRNHRIQQKGFTNLGSSHGVPHIPGPHHPRRTNPSARLMLPPYLNHATGLPCLDPSSLTPQLPSLPLFHLYRLLTSPSPQFTSKRRRTTETESGCTESGRSQAVSTSFRRRKSEN